MSSLQKITFFKSKYDFNNFVNSYKYKIQWGIWANSETQELDFNSCSGQLVFSFLMQSREVRRENDKNLQHLMNFSEA